MQLRRSPISLVVVSVYYYSYYSCLFSSLSWSFTDFVLFRIPRATTYRTTLIQYTDDHTPTPFSEKVPASPYKALMPKEAVPLPAPLVLPRPKQTVSVPVAAVKAASLVSKTVTVPEEKELSLYEVLGVSPMATREEMKLRYNALVKRHHPDAVKHRPRPRLMFVGPGSAAHSFSSSHPQQDQKQHAQKAIKKEPDFGEITAAWAVLSDDKARRKYDRGLLYQKWADQASKVAMKTMEEAAPVMAKMMDKVALPLMETTAVSTAKIAKAAYQRMEDSMIISTVKASPPDVPPAANNNKNVKKTIASAPPPAAVAASVPSVVVQEKDLGGVSSISMNEVVSKITLPARPVADAPVPSEKTATPWVPTTGTPTTITSRTKATTTSSTAPFFSNPVVAKPTTMTETNQKMMKKLEPVSTTKKPTMSTDAMRKLPLWTLLLQMILFV